MFGKTRIVLVVLCLGLLMILTTGCGKKQIETDTMDTMKTEQGETEAERLARERAERERRLQEEALREEQMRSEEMKQAVTEISENRIFFDFDSFELKPEARAVLQKKAEYLKEFPSLTMTIQGHCDERGTNEYNLALGQRRAQAAYDFLVLLGIDGKRMKTVSFGEEKPLVQGSNEEAWAKNRRDEFVVH